MNFDEALEQIRHNDCAEYCMGGKGNCSDCRWGIAIDALKKQIPKKPNWITDNTWGIATEQPVCPTCDNYVDKVLFIGDGSWVTNKMKSYCSTCGQAIDWEAVE